jgi:hypothetical protein
MTKKYEMELLDFKQIDLSPLGIEVDKLVIIAKFRRKYYVWIEDSNQTIPDIEVQTHSTAFAKKKDALVLFNFYFDMLINSGSCELNQQKVIDPA